MVVVHTLNTVIRVETTPTQTYTYQLITTDTTDPEINSKNTKPEKVRNLIVVRKINK